MSKNEVRVRFAPSPTGPLHIGGVRTALYNYLFARKNNGKFLLRIEDTDQNRLINGAEKYIIDSLKWCKIQVDEGVSVGGEFGPYKQSERKDVYKKYVFDLIKNNKAYYAFDSNEELNTMRSNLKKEGKAAPQYNSISRSRMKNSLTLSKKEVEERLRRGDKYVIRILIPRNQEIKFKDEIRGWISVNSNNLDDKVLYKSDGMPTYHLANVVDDYLMKISHVIRGEEWLPSAPLHILLYQYLGWENKTPTFAHLPLILKPDGKGKLSKRDGVKYGFPVFPISWDQNDKSFIGYKEFGFSPDAFNNMLALLGWNPGNENEIFNMNELIENFSLKKVNKSGAKFDFKKTVWFNEQHLKKMSGEEIIENFDSSLLKSFSREYLVSVANLIKERAKFVNEVEVEGKYFFSKPKIYDEKLIKKKWNDDNKFLIKEILFEITNIEVFSANNISKCFNDFLNKKNLNFGEIMPILRVIVSGIKFGPPLNEIFFLLGKKEVISRIKFALNNL